MTRGVSTTLPTTLPARYTRGFRWALDKRSQVARELASDLWELWTDQGGVENLSAKELDACERVAFIRRLLLAHESAVLHNSLPPELRGGDKADRPLTMEPSTYCSYINALLGLMKALSAGGMKRKAKPTRSLREIMAQGRAA